jgi:hypothetical protein
MIRRDIMLENGTAGWLFISQVEHARISGELTRAWHEPISHEVVAAIVHHDDGWAKWEAAPQLDPARGRPLSFLEMHIADAIGIWNDSIATVRRIGPLAGAIVAGHFLGLASGSDHAVDPRAREWLHEMSIQRAAWLSEWRSESSANTPAIAERGQQMLLTADLLSLWLCCDGPVTGVDPASVPNAEMLSRASTVLGKYQFVSQDKSMRDCEIAWQGSLTPWPFAVAELNLVSPVLAVSAAHYRSWPEILAASRQVRLLWRLRQALIPSGDCR